MALGVLIPSTVPHPSNRGLNNPGGRERLRHALAVTKSVIDGSHSGTRTEPSRQEGCDRERVFGDMGMVADVRALQFSELQPVGNLIAAPGNREGNGPAPGTAG